MEQPQKPSPRRLSPGSSPRPGTPSPPAPNDNGVAQHKRLRSLQTELKKESKNQLLAVPEPTSPPLQSKGSSAPNTMRNRRLQQRPPRLNIKLKEQRDLMVEDENKEEEDLEIEELLIEFCNSCSSKKDMNGQKMINVSDLSLYLRGQIPQFMQQYNH